MYPELSREIKEKIIQGWLSGVPRDLLAESMDVAEGTVTNVVEFYKQNDNLLDLQRQIAVIIRKTGSDVIQFASNMRWANALKRAACNNENVMRFILDSQKEFDLNGINESHTITTLVQIADMLTIQKIPFTEIGDHLQKEYAELEKVELDIAANNEILNKSNAEVDSVLAKNRLHLDEIERYCRLREELQRNGLDMNDVKRSLTCITNLKLQGFKTSIITFKLGQILSVEGKLVELDKECNNYETNLQKFRVKLNAANGYWGQHEASTKLYANAISMGLSPQNIFDAVTIFGNNSAYTPQVVINDLETYGDLKAAIFIIERHLKELESRLDSFQMKP